MIPVLGFEGVSAIEAIGALAAFRAARLDAELVSDEPLIATHEGGARLVPARLGYATLPGAACVFVPGGDITKAMRDSALTRALRARRGHWTLASGDGAALIAAAGLAEGRRVAGPTTARVVADGRLVTSAPGDAAADLALHYVAREHGDERAAKAAHAMGREYRPFAMGASHEP